MLSYSAIIDRWSQSTYTSERMVRKLFAGTILPAAILLTVFAASPDAKRPRILGLTHVAVRVHDLNASRHFYSDLLGFEEAFSVDSNHKIFFKVNDRQYVVLIPESQPEDQRFVDYALETDDAEGLRLYLKSQGYKVPDRPAGKGPSY